MSARVTDQPANPVDDSQDFSAQPRLSPLADEHFVEPPIAAAASQRERDFRDAARVSPSPATHAVHGDAAAAAGPLRDVEPDTMTLHTREAYQLFIGRKHEPGSPLMPIAGGRKFAAVLKSLWHLSGEDNPYADWVLIELSKELAALRSRLDRATRQREDMMAQMRRKGLALSVMSSRSPVVVTLGFRSPYGYATAQAIVEFDYCVRVIKTLIHKDCISDIEGRSAIRALTREMRHLFLGAVRWERLLLRDEFSALSRGDFLPDADTVARRRGEAATVLFGPLPQPILLGGMLPRHARRRAGPATAEQRAVRKVARGAADNSALPAQALL